MPKRTPTRFVIGLDAQQLDQIPGVRVAEVEDSRFVIDGLDEGTDYWFCAGTTTGTHEGVVGFDVCNDPDVDVPGTLTASGPDGGNISGAADH